jgi:hypothetical protein
MTRRQKDYFQLALFALFFLLLFTLYAIAPAQELHIHPPVDPAQLAPLSCRGLVAHEGLLLERAAPLQTTKKGESKYRETAKLLRSMKTIDHVCARPVEMKNLLVWSMLAESQIVNDFLARQEESRRLALIGPIQFVEVK